MYTLYLFSLLHIEICEIILTIGIKTPSYNFVTLLSCNYNTTKSIKTNNLDSSNDVASADQLKHRLCRSNRGAQEGNLARYLNIEIMQVTCNKLQFGRRLLGYCVSTTNV